MCLINLKNTVFSYGLMFVFLGMILPGNAASVVPGGCDGAEDIGNQEDQLLTRQLSYSLPDDPVDCYKFTVGSGSGLTQLSVYLEYTHDTAWSDGLILKLFDSTSSDILKQTTKGGGDYSGDQGSETLFWESADGLLSGETYYIRIDNDGNVSDGYEYKVKWNDDDDAPDISNPDPANNLDVPSGGSGQILRVDVTDAVDCKIYYSADGSTWGGPDTVTPSGGLCQTTVPYGINMTDNGTNYWYVEATNTAGTTRYPSTGTLSFTVSSGGVPVVSNPIPADGSSVAAGTSDQLLRVDTNADSCTIHYGTDTDTSEQVTGTINGGYCETTISVENGTKYYWYVEATNTEGTTRYPGTGTLSFTVSSKSSILLFIPVIMSSSSDRSIRVEE